MRNATPTTARPTPTGVKSNIAELLAHQLAPHPRDDDIGRGADQGRDPAEQGAERHRHQEGGGRGAGPPGDLEGDRHEHGESADVLHERRQGRHGKDQHEHLRLGGRRVGSDATHDGLGHARAGHGGAYQKRTRDDDDDVVGKAAERLFRGHDADPDGREQRQGRDEVVAEATPNKESHHHNDDAEGQALLEGHEASRKGRRGGLGEAQVFAEA